MCGSRCAGAAAARCSVMSANPPRRAVPAACSARRSAARAAGPRARSGCGSRPRRSAGGRRAATARRCRSRSRTCARQRSCALAASEPAMVRSSCERPLTGARRRPSGGSPVSRLTTAAAAAGAPQIFDAEPGRSSVPNAPRLTGVDQQLRLRERGQPRAVLRRESPAARTARPISSTSTLRSVISSSSRFRAAGRPVRAGRGRPSRPGPATAPGRPGRPRAAIPGRRPPTRPAWNGTSEAWPSRT